jgi:hypothetical protein
MYSGHVATIKTVVSIAWNRYFSARYPLDDPGEKYEYIYLSVMRPMYKRFSEPGIGLATGTRALSKSKPITI